MNKLFVFIVLCDDVLSVHRIPIYIRWNPKHLSDSRHLWVPISWENGAPVLKNDKKHGRSARF